MKMCRPAMPDPVASSVSSPGTVAERRETVSSPEKRSKRPVRARSRAATASSAAPVRRRGAPRANSASTRKGVTRPSRPEESRPVEKAKPPSLPRTEIAAPPMVYPTRAPRSAGVRARSRRSMSMTLGRKSKVRRELLSEMRPAQARASAAWRRRASTLNGSSEAAFCSSRRTRPSAATESKAGLMTRTSFQTFPVASSRAALTSSFWKASSRPATRPSTLTRRGKIE